MITHLKDRAAALAALGWTGADAEWLAFVCLHSGAFVRSQYLTFSGESHPMHAARFLTRCGGIVVEDSWNGGAARFCRVIARPVYRALGAEHIRHRRQASAALTLRRLLAFDYVLDHADRPWLPTEDEKVTALRTAGVAESALPRRVYPGAHGGTGQTRYFVQKLPVALDASGAVFVYVLDSVLGLRTWGASHAAVWAALRAKGRTVSVVLVGRPQDGLEAGETVLSQWTTAGPPDAHATGEAAELAALRLAVAETRTAALARYGGFEGAVQRLIQLEDQGAGDVVAGVVAGSSGDAADPQISAGAVWRSDRVVL